MVPNNRPPSFEPPKNPELDEAIQLSPYGAKAVAAIYKGHQTDEAIKSFIGVDPADILLGVTVRRFVVRDGDGYELTGIGTSAAKYFHNHMPEINTRILQLTRT